MNRRGLAAAGIGAAVGVRSIVGLGVSNGRLDADEFVYIRSILVTVGVTGGITIVLATNMTGAISANPAYGDRLYGTIAPFVISTSQAAPQAPVVTLMGADLMLQANVLTSLPLGVILRAADHFPNASSRINVQPNTDNIRIDVAFEWEVMKDVR